MKITKLFEQKFLLGWGRHLWNVVGVSGFIAVLTGIILFGNSLTTQTPKSKMKFIGKKEFVTDEMTKETAPLSRYQWESAEDKVVPFLSIEEWSEVNSKPYPFSSDKKKLINRDVWYEYVEYSNMKYDEYLKVATPLIRKRNEQDKRYRSYVTGIQSRNSIKRSHGYVSPFVVGYGLAVIASASVSSALLSIERNTRKD